MPEPQTDKDRLLDHNYDGIEEYDNPLPGWWVYIFWGTIIFCLPYVMWYHWGVGPSIEDNLDAEIASYGEQLIAAFGDLEPDETTIVSYMDDSAAMAAMSGLFKGKCAQCHMADGSGNVGPNLTDNRWINITTAADIATVLRTGGRIGKGMPAWEGQLSQTQIVLLSSYVAQLGRTLVNGKAPEPESKVVDPWPPVMPEPGEAPSSDGQEPAPSAAPAGDSP
jgi:cytochrome c oxidase cbb3-type subunit 3